MADHLGQQLGKYRLTRLLGTGGFAEVYLGEHILLGTEAAIKMLHAQLATEAEVEKFRQEARTVAGLVHPNIVRVLDFAVEGGTPYLVMDYAPNGSLRQLLPAGTPLAPTSIAPYLVQVADALQYAHDQKLVHRDIKPENMLLGRRNEVLLTDFGIATVAQNTSQQKTEGVAGTAAYMAPEQLQGKPRQSSDLYSLAVVIYEWLTGARPFQGTFAEVASQHLFTPPLALRERVPAISPAVEQVVLTALAKDPRERFGSVRAFANAFLQASGAPVSFPSLATQMASSGAHPAVGPISAAGILVSAESQQTPRITPQLATPSAPATPGTQPAPSIFSVATQLTPPSPPAPAMPGGQVMPSVYFAETQLTPPTAGTAIPQGGTGPTPAIFAASGPGAAAGNEGGPVTYLPPGWRTSTAPDVPSRSKTSLTGGVPVPGMPPGDKRKRGRLLVISLVAVLVLALVGGGVAYAVFGGLLHTGASATTVTITPKSSDLNQTFNITGVTGTPDASQMQVGARMVSVTTTAVTQTVNATGQQTTPGTPLTGPVLVTNNDPANPLNLPAGSSYSNNAGCGPSNLVMVLDSAVNLPPDSQSVPSTTVQMHLSQVGPVLTGSPCSPAFVMHIEGDCSGAACWSISSEATSSLTDGTNPQTQTVVAQSDIDNAANSLIQAHQPDASQVLQGQLQPNERLAGTPQCNPNTSADHNAGDVADQVTVTVTFTCSGEAYDHDGALSLASQLLTDQAETNPGAGYALAGKIRTTLVSATPNNQGVVAMVVKAEGIWVYQFDSGQKQALARLIAGKSQQEATNLLAAQTGIARVSIQIAGNGQNLPTNASLITVNVQAVSGL